MNTIQGKTPVVISPGRFNPPHLGHRDMIVGLQVLAQALNATPVVIIIDSGKIDPSNPLPGSLRYRYLQKMFPVADFDIRIAVNAYAAIESLIEDDMYPVGGVTGSDRKSSYKELIGRVMGQEVMDNYVDITLPRGVTQFGTDSFSGSKLRQAALINNEHEVVRMTGLDYDEIQHLMETIRGGPIEPHIEDTRGKNGKQIQSKTEVTTV